MSIQMTTIKKLYAKSANQCAFPKCTAPIIVDGIAVGGDVRAPIKINHSTQRKSPVIKYPVNSIGADANMAGYVDYLFGLGVDYWKSIPKMTPGRIGK